jgi:hypothetical protein
MTDGALQLGAC